MVSVGFMLVGLWVTFVFGAGVSHVIEENRHENDAVTVYNISVDHHGKTANVCRESVPVAEFEVLR